MTTVPQPFEAPAPRSASTEVRTVLTTVTVLVVGGFLVIFALLMATPAATTSTPPAPATPFPVVPEYDTTGGLVWSLYLRSGGSLAP
ncbi:hypothetical protein EV188_102182 [Actinomycetospora succinea]|uniref:Uncharacterized protein n=1 Tax=Actinomycetospora succinea TaxID=663603 RepID=A0A4R6VGU3_9PSEU|nr:hypothetical protein [Actinomycetospora succinea]TDQ62528.1 hypothetical protein EV188_102182 [Actinomycetospora succinea]